MRAFPRYALTTGFLWAACAAPLLAQQGAPAGDANGFFEAVRSLDTGKLAIVLIFGSGIIATLGYAIAGIIRAFSGSPDDSEELIARVDELEERIEKLEAQTRTPAQV